MKTTIDERVWDKMTKGVHYLAMHNREVEDRAYREIVINPIAEESVSRFEHDA